MNFNKEQQSIIESIKGVFLISAPVGTGKTTVLTERVFQALKSGIKPEEILCLTFTNRAAEEMLERIRERVDDKQVFEKITIKTFHGFCAYFIKQESKRLNVNSDFTIFEDEEQIEVLKSVLENHPDYYINKEKEIKEIRALIEKIYKYRIKKMELSIGLKISEIEIDKEEKEIAEEYMEALADQNAMDFDELVITTIKGLYLDEELKNKWSLMYKFIQLDEFQDTHLSEYLVVKQLAREYKNISFIGDLDQTIYSWRGSEPYFIVRLIKSHFPKMQEKHLKVNYRFNPSILGAVKSFLRSFEKSNTKELNSHDTSSGTQKCIDVFSGYNFFEEISWVIENVQNIHEQDSNAKIVVLSRANYVIKKTANIFLQKGVSHITVDKYEFFRRQEIKDIYAYLKLIFNRFDLESSYRLVKRPPRKIGPVTIKNIREEGNSIALKVSDFLNFYYYRYPEPFANIINQWRKGRIVVLDTETTGVNTLEDEIIQIFAIEIIDGKKGREFYYFLKNTIPVGNSEKVHHISDEHLKKEGRNPKEVLEELKQFINDDVVVGHNVNFDLNMIYENGKRHSVDFDFKEYYDTLDMARRLVTDVINHKLGTLVKRFDLTVATHDARDDVLATVDLLDVLLSMLRKNQTKRINLFKKYSAKFINIATSIDKWQKMAKTKRPKDLMLQVWKESGLEEYYSKQDDSIDRIKSINELGDIFEKKDDSEKRSEVSLRELITYASLVKDINFLGLEQGKIPIVTAHQVKGLEFDYVFIIGVNNFSFPIYKADIEEEKRLFYVAMTRAKRKIFISYSRFKENNMPMQKSKFIDYIDSKYINFIS